MAGSAQIIPWLGRVVAVFIGCLLVVTLEGSLRLTTQWQPPALVMPLTQHNNQILYTINPDYPKLFFTGTVSGAALNGIRMAPRPFVMPKGSKTFRVVFVGGSTVQGFPHPERLSAASYLEAMLQDAWPQRKVEVFNLGVTAVASFAVTRMVEAAKILEPDLVVVYTGHNEFYGVYGAASLGQGGRAPWSKLLYYNVMQFRLTSIVRSLIGGLATDPSATNSSLLQVMSGAGAVMPTDLRRQDAEHNLTTHLVQIKNFCQSQQIPLVLCTLVSNDTGFAPGVAPIPKILRETDQKVWNQALAAAEILFERSVTDDEIRKLLAGLIAAERLYDQDASVHFFKGMCLTYLEKWDAAKQSFLQARKFDPRPWRAPEEFNQIIRGLANQDKVLVADIAAEFEKMSQKNGIGWNLMVDHLHPSAWGQYEMARVIATALMQADGREHLSVAAQERIGNQQEYRRRLGDLPLEQLIVRQSMAGLLGEPPMDRGNKAQVRRLLAEGQEIWNGLSSGERRGYQAWQSGKGKELLVLSAANQLFAEEEFLAAESYYRAASFEKPYTIMADLWATMRWGRCRELRGLEMDQTGRRTLEAALDRLEFIVRAPDINPALETFFRGYGLHLLGEYDLALKNLEVALQEPSIRQRFFFDLLYLLGEELIRAGRQEDAVRIIHEVTAEVGQPTFGQQLLNQLQIK